MEEKSSIFETLLDKSADYGKSSYELIKLKALDKSSDVISTLFVHSIVFVLIIIFMLFFNLGLAFWIGKLLENTYYGFLVVGGFYVVIAFIIHFLLHNWIKKSACNYIIKRVLN